MVQRNLKIVTVRAIIQKESAIRQVQVKIERGIHLKAVRQPTEIVACDNHQSNNNKDATQRQKSTNFSSLYCPIHIHLMGDACPLQNLPRGASLVDPDTVLPNVVVLVEFLPFPEPVFRFFLFALLLPLSLKFPVIILVNVEPEALLGNVFELLVELQFFATLRF